MAEQGMTEWDYQQTGNTTLRHLLDSLLLPLQNNIPLKATQIMTILGLLLIQAAFYLLSMTQPLSCLQSVFMLILPAFLANYWFMRSAGVLPYLKDDQESVISKAMAIAQVVAQASAVYVWPSSSRFMMLLLATTVLGLFILYSLSQGTQSKQTILGALMILVSSVYLLYLNDSPSLPHKDSSDWAAVVAVASQSYVLFSLGRVPSSCVVTLVHQLLLIQLVFLPMCFQIERIVRPTILAWSVSLPCSLLLLLGLLFLTRACQLQKDQLVTVCAMECYLGTIVSQPISTLPMMASLLVAILGLLLTQGEEFGGKNGLYPEERQPQLSLHLVQREKVSMEMSNLF